MPRKNRKRLTIDIPEIMHIELKKIADKRYMTLTKLVHQMIMERIKWEKQYE